MTWHPYEVRLVLFVALVSCHPAAPLSPVSGTCSKVKDPQCSDKDDGAGVLANASSRLLSGDGNETDPMAPRKKKRTPEEDEYGGADYAGYVVPGWTPPPSVHRTYPRHAQVAGLAGAIEGTITWRGALPPKRSTTCGPIDALRIAEDRGLPDTLIVIENVKTGRQMPSEGRSATVGGALVKRGCQLYPTAQIVTPLPAALDVAGDRDPTRLRVTTQPSTPEHTYSLQEGGRVAFTVALGITRIEAVDGSLGAAFVLGSDAPYYAVTDDHGRFRIDELAPGTYDVTIWHAPLPDTGTGPLHYGEPLVEHRNVTVAGTKPSRLDVAIGR